MKSACVQQLLIELMAQAEMLEHAVVAQHSHIWLLCSLLAMAMDAGKARAVFET